jgi:hypothetical protein
MADFIFRDVGRFTGYIPTAAGSDLDNLRPYLADAELWLRNEILGAPLYYAILTISLTPPGEAVFDGTFDYTFDETIPPSDILKATEEVICLKAYLSGIPFLDLIQTSNGFAVVSNSNQAPASKERVERLLEFVKRRLTDALDFLFEFAFSYSTFRDLWKQAGEVFRRHTEIVFLTTGELKRYSANQSATFMDLLTLHPVILSIQADIAGYFSTAYMEELIEKRRNAGLSAFDIRILRSVQILAGLKLQRSGVLLIEQEINRVEISQKKFAENSADFHPLIEQEVNYMTDHPAGYPTYMASAEYRLKVSRKYENEKEHATYMFL